MTERGKGKWAQVIQQSTWIFCGNGKHSSLARPQVNAPRDTSLVSMLPLRLSHPKFGCQWCQQAKLLESYVLLANMPQLASELPRFHSHFQGQHRTSRLDCAAAVNAADAPRCRQAAVLVKGSRGNVCHFALRCLVDVGDFLRAKTLQMLLYLRGILAIR